jgi:alpha-amylase/alpha-mannosidase (GH57 family)
LLYNTKIAKEATPKILLPKINFSYPEDARAQIDSAINFYKERFGSFPCGMWPSEQAVSNHILGFIIQGGINWIVADEGILFKSLRRKKRPAFLLYQPHFVKRKEGRLNIVFRDRNLSDLIGFVYHKWKTEVAVNDFMKHLEIIHQGLKNQDILVTIAMDGENAWEYYPDDGHGFLELLYEKLSQSKIIKTVTVSEYLKKNYPQLEIKRLAAGSWIYAEFGKWIGNPQKLICWEWLAKARKELDAFTVNCVSFTREKLRMAYKQIYILEGSDWFWWAGEDPAGDFAKIFRMHLVNFYTIIGKEAPDYLKKPL